MQRIKYIDGLRGIAILAVVLGHAYKLYEPIEPFKQLEIVRDIFSYSTFGATLFLVMSGHVIYMNISKKTNLLMLAVNAYLRLAPTMILVSLLIFITSPLIPERPDGIVLFQDLLQSVTFIQPYFLTKITGIPIKIIEGGFWTIFVIVKFYVVAGFFYFILNDKKLFGPLMGHFAYLLTSLILKLGLASHHLQLLHHALEYAGFRYHGWLLIGALTYRWLHHQPNNNWLTAMLSLTIALQITMYHALFPSRPLITPWIVLVLFLIPVFSDRAKALLSHKSLLLLGFISYPFYLIHQNLVTGLAIKLYHTGIVLPNFFYPIPPLLLAMILSYCIAKIEPKMRTFIAQYVPESIYGLSIKVQKTTEPKK